MKKKLSQSRGETLVEVLAAVLIATLSIALLFGGIMASINIDQTTRTSDETFYKDLSAAESQEAPDPVETMKVTVTGNGTSKDLTVNVYGGTVRSYAKGVGP